MTDYEQKTIDYYNRNSDAFQKSVDTANMSESCDRFLSYFSKPAYILDLGCGTGRDSQYFLQHGHSVLPADGSKEMCRIASELTGVQAKIIRFNELDYKEEFDGVWACASLLHVQRDVLPQVLCRINKALKPNGILYMSFKYGNTSGERNGRFFTDMTEDDLPLLCSVKIGFDIIEYYISHDVRPERNHEKWLNIIAKKKHKNNDKYKAVKK